ncbi:MAG: SAM-dependent methyltransferase [Alphaproteobacteria bacterium]|nr:SAM-dependent methyltransferase [Alphaproteobacteria bacterium]
MGLLERIYAQIDEDGGISIADYMRFALADPDEGYYMSQNPLGIEGDFVTSPEICQVFGEMLGIWIAECWHMLGKPQADLVEMGPGLGTLMDDFLRATHHVEGFHEAIDVHMVETSEKLRRKQKQLLDGKHPRISWHDTIPSNDKPLLVIGNEFFDALPIEQYVAEKKGFRERIIVRDAEDENKLAFDVADTFYRRLPTQFPRIKASEMRAGSVIEICPAAQELMKTITDRIVSTGGAALFIDYGYSAPLGQAYHVRGDTLQAVRKHKYHNVLENPGQADITAHVDFTSLCEIAVAAGGYVPPIMTQADFLLRMGGETRVKQLCVNAHNKQICEDIVKAFMRLVNEQDMGNLFKVMAVMPAGIPAPLFPQSQFIDS